MNKILFDEQPIVIDKVLARKIGLNEAIVIQQVHYWLKINEKKTSITSTTDTGRITH